MHIDVNLYNYSVRDPARLEPRTASQFDSAYAPLRMTRVSVSIFTSGDRYTLSRSIYPVRDSICAAHEMKKGNRVILPHSPKFALWYFRASESTPFVPSYPRIFSLIKLSISCGRDGIGFYEYFIEA